jgi:hypothetical protein
MSMLRLYLFDQRIMLSVTSSRQVFYYTYPCDISEIERATDPMNHSDANFYKENMAAYVTHSCTYFGNGDPEIPPSVPPEVPPEEVPIGIPPGGPPEIEPEPSEIPGSEPPEVPEPPPEGTG